MDFEVVGELTATGTIAVGRRIRWLAQTRERYGEGTWRKLKGIATVRLPGGRVRRAEIHWLEAHGIGRRCLKIKRFLD